MPSAEHEAIAELLSLDPARLAAFLTACLSVQIPRFDVARVVDSNLSDRNPTQNHADHVLLFENRDGHGRFALIFEVQRRPDADKVYAWFLYLAMARRRHQCPAMVVVIATTRAAATFAATEIDTGHPGCTFTPVVWGPDQVPAITDPALAADNPCAAAFAVIIHQEEPDQLRAFATTVSYLNDPQARFYAGLVLRALAKDPRQILEGIMATARYDYWAKLADEQRQEGREEGSLSATVQAVLTVLGARGLAVPAAVRERIQRCGDTNQLTAWLQRAATVTKADDLFA
jgi:hypothetical protein